MKQVTRYNRYLQLPGMRSGGMLVSIKLVHPYIASRTTRGSEIPDERPWLAERHAFAPAEMRRKRVSMPKVIETAAANGKRAFAWHRVYTRFGPGRRINL